MATSIAVLQKAQCREELTFHKVVVSLRWWGERTSGKAWVPEWSRISFCRLALASLGLIQTRNGWTSTTGPWADSSALLDLCEYLRKRGNQVSVGLSIAAFSTVFELTLVMSSITS